MCTATGRGCVPVCRCSSVVFVVVGNGVTTFSFVRPTILCFFSAFFLPFFFFFFSMQLLMLFFLGAVTAVITVWCYHCRCSPLKASSWEVWTVNVVERHNSSSGRLILLTLVSYVSDLFYGRLKLSTYFLGKEM